MGLLQLGAVLWMLTFSKVIHANKVPTLDTFTSFKSNEMTPLSKPASLSPESDVLPSDESSIGLLHPEDLDQRHLQKRLNFKRGQSDIQSNIGYASPHTYKDEPLLDKSGYYGNGHQSMWNLKPDYFDSYKVNEEPYTSNAGLENDVSDIDNEVPDASSQIGSYEGRSIKLPYSYGYYDGLKRSAPYYSFREPYNFDGKRSPSGMGARGFHEGIFTHNFGEFSPVKRGMSGTGKLVNKRRPEMDSAGFYGDLFTGGFGDFYTMRKRSPLQINPITSFVGRYHYNKQMPELDGFIGYNFPGAFGELYPMTKRRPEMDAAGFYGDTFSGGFGDFYTMKKKGRPEMDASGFHGDLFSNGFGEFYTMKRGNPTELSQLKQKLNGDAFIKLQKRGPEMTARGFHGDIFSHGFGNFRTMKRNQKRRPEMTASGFHGDMFSNGFGQFSTMKKRLETQRKILLSLEALKDRMRARMNPLEVYNER